MDLEETTQGPIGVLESGQPVVLSAGGMSSAGKAALQWSYSINGAPPVIFQKGGAYAVFIAPPQGTAHDAADLTISCEDVLSSEGFPGRTSSLRTYQLVGPSPLAVPPALSRSSSTDNPQGNHGPKVFGLGFPRTGLGSLGKALATLGCEPAAWPFTWERLAGVRGAVSSVFCSRYRELDQRFPGSKFILTVREEESLLRSCEKRYNRARGRRAGMAAPAFDPDSVLLAYRTQVSQVKRYFEGRPQDLLVLDIAAGQGWKELGTFLSLSPQSSEFPWINRGSSDMSEGLGGAPDWHLTLAHEAARQILRESPVPFQDLFEPFVSKETYDSMAGTSEGHNDLRFLLYLNALARAIKPRKVLVLGTAEGAPALFMLLGMPEQSVLYAIDAPQNEPVYLKKGNWGNRAVLVQGDPLSPAHQSTLDLRGIDLLFIDLRATERALSAYRGCLSPDAIVVMDDIHLNAEMDRFWTRLTAPKLDTGKEFHWSGFGLVHFRADY